MNVALGRRAGTCNETMKIIIQNYEILWSYLLIQYFILFIQNPRLTGRNQFGESSTGKIIISTIRKERGEKQKIKAYRSSILKKYSTDNR